MCAYILSPLGDQRVLYFQKKSRQDPLYWKLFFITKCAKATCCIKMSSFISNIKAITSHAAEVHILADGFVTGVVSIPYCQMVKPTFELMMHLGF